MTNILFYGNEAMNITACTIAKQRDGHDVPPHNLKKGAPRLCYASLEATILDRIKLRQSKARN